MGKSKSQEYWERTGYNEKHNNTRRDRYKNDPEYRERVRNQRVKSYRKTTNTRKRTVMSLGSIGLFVTNDATKEFHCDVNRMAKIIGFSRSTVLRWINNGLFPEPTDGKYNWIEVQFISGQFRRFEKNTLSKKDVEFVSTLNDGVAGIRS